MRTLHISVLDKKATYLSRDGDIVCGNSDYVIEFAFDAEWDAHTEKVARFIWNGQYKDVTFTGTSCVAPIITNASEVEVGVYAGELSTTTPAVIGCQKSILCKSTPPSGIPFTKGEKGDPGVSGTIYTVAIPSATDTDLMGWEVAGSGSASLRLDDVAWATEDLFYELESENAAIVTEHNLSVLVDNGSLEISLNSLPKTATNLYIVVPIFSNGGELN